MDYFNDVFTCFRGFESGSCVDCQSMDRTEFALKKIFICVPKMKKSLTGLVRHEGEQLMAEFLFVGELVVDNKASDCKKPTVLF